VAPQRLQTTILFAAPCFLSQLSLSLSPALIVLRSTFSALCVCVREWVSECVPCVALTTNQFTLHTDQIAKFFSPARIKFHYLDEKELAGFKGTKAAVVNLNLRIFVIWREMEIRGSR
jgi:hypothetical protein